MSAARLRPRPGLVGQPRARASTCSPCALGLHVELEVGRDRARSRVVTDLPIAARPPQPRRARRSSRSRPADGHRVPDPLRGPALGRPGHERRRDRRRARRRRTRCTSSTPTCSRYATALEGHPDNVAAALLGGFVLCADGRARALRRPRRARGGARRAARAACAPPRRGRRCPPRCRWPTPSSTSPTPGLLVLGLVRGDWDLVARGLADRLHQPRREHLYPRSMALVRARAGARRARRDDLGRRADRARLVRLRGDRRRSSARLAGASAQGWAEVRHVAFEPQRRRRASSSRRCGRPRRAAA